MDIGSGKASETLFVHKAFVAPAVLSEKKPSVRLINNDGVFRETFFV